MVLIPWATSMTSDAVLMAFKLIKKYPFHVVLKPTVKQMFNL